VIAARFLKNPSRRAKEGNAMKVLVVGAGGQGGPCASILARDESVDEIRLYDLDESIAKKVADKIASKKIVTGKIDATDVDQVHKAAEGVDVVIDLVMPWMAKYVMQGALRANAHYVNTAFDTPFWEEFKEGKTLSYSKEFADAGLTALLGCGMAPGVVNVFAKLYADKLDDIESIKIRLGKKNLGGGVYDDLTKPWNPGWAPIQALKDCNDRAICFQEGTHEYVEPYTGIEEWKFPEPIGTLLVSHHSHEEPYSLPGNIKKGMEYCDFKYYVHPQPASLVALGLTSDKEVDVKGIKVKPIDLVAALLPKAGNAFFDEDPSKFDYLDTHAFVCMDIEIKGAKDGTDKTFLIRLPKMTSPAQKIYDLFGTSLVNVALPVVIGAKMILEDAAKGVIFAEELDPSRFINRMMATGYPYTWDVFTD
jgi:saccharopine dehydrogenase (NAD+, L-lysine-forming)